MITRGRDIGIQMFKNPLLMDTLILNDELTADDTLVIGETSSVAGTGAKTTSITCCFVLALLCKHQDIRDRVLEEQKDMFWEDFQRPVTTEDLPLVTYLEQVTL
jgi:cytochrome P450